MVSLAVGLIIVSFVLSYAWWCRVRVIRLRNFFFDMRDWLDARAGELGATSDRAYLACRTSLNSSAEMAQDLSIGLVGYLLSTVKAEEEKSDVEALQKVLDECSQKVADRLFRYLFFEMATGLVAIAAVKTFRLRYLFEQVQTWLRRWFMSSSPLEALESQPRRKSTPFGWLGSRS